MKRLTLIRKTLFAGRPTPLAPAVIFFLGLTIVIGLPAESAIFESLNVTLTPYLAQYNLPALAAAVVRDGQVVAASAVGTRRAGTGIPVMLNDRFHISGRKWKY